MDISKQVPGANTKDLIITRLVQVHQMKFHALDDGTSCLFPPIDNVGKL